MGVSVTESGVRISTLARASVAASAASVRRRLARRALPPLVFSEFSFMPPSMILGISPLAALRLPAPSLRAFFSATAWILRSISAILRSAVFSSCSADASSSALRSV
ncbi:hypothetical protein D3C72_1583770 [compost metagenome]